MKKQKFWWTILLLMMFVSLGTLRAQTTYETLYISAQDYMNDLRSNTASWKNSRNLDSDTMYVGEVSNGVPNGQGTAAYPNGEKYEDPRPAPTIPTRNS